MLIDNVDQFKINYNNIPFTLKGMQAAIIYITHTKNENLDYLYESFILFTTRNITYFAIYVNVK